MKKIYIPSNLNLSKMLNCDKNLLDKLHYFIHLIYEQKILYKTTEEFIPLKAAYIRNIIRDYQHCRQILVDNKILQCDYRFIKGKKSYGYKLLPPYSEVRHMQVILTNRTMIKNIEKWKQKRLPQTDIHMHLYNFLQKVEIKYNNALLYVNMLDTDEYNPAKMAIDKFLNKDFFLYGDNYGRVHTNITCLKSHLRKYLSYKGEELVNIDVINSQPLFLLLLPPLSLPIRCTFSKEIESSDLYLMKYKHLVENGLFYDYLMQHMGDNDRKAFKERFFRETFFGKKVSNEFQELFPTIGNKLREIKENDYRTLAWMMQRAESDLIINKICRRIMDEYPDCFISTIHDSILTTKSNANKIAEIVLQEFGKVDLMPSIRIETA